MYCKKCGFKNETDARFCEKCGAGLQDAKNSLQLNKGLLKVIMGCIVLLYVLVIVDFAARLGFNSVYKAGDWGDDNVMSWYNARENITTMLIILSVFVFVAILVLFFTKRIKKSFGITAILLCVYAAIGGAVAAFQGLVWLFLVFIAATVTVLVYKYSFAENQKLI
jgi:hypothetical protein